LDEIKFVGSRQWNRWRHRVSSEPKTYVSNIEINKGSILLLFKSGDAAIVRKWRKGESHAGGDTDYRPA